MSAPYQRLPGTYRSFAGKQTLWLADDHLLLVDNHRFGETYRRYYFRDIKALVLRAGVSRGARAWSLDVTTTIAVLSVLSILLVWWSIWQVLALTAVVLGFYALYRFLPRRCACYVVTGLGADQLAPLWKLQTAEPALQKLRQRILEAQGGELAIPGEYLHTALAPVEPPLLQPVAAADFPHVPPAPAAPYRFHAGLAAVHASLVPIGLLMLAWGRELAWFWGSAFSLLCLAMLGLVWGLVVAQRPGSPARLKLLTIASLLLTAVLSTVTYTIASLMLQQTDMQSARLSKFLLSVYNAPAVQMTGPALGILLALSGAAAVAVMLQHRGGQT